jgi:2-polyprenyl-3-methyl-5-hydroxy-6-metoxy-1,4-benzoquinol methylase
MIERAMRQHSGKFETNEGINPSYTAERRGLLRLVPPTCRRILDVGCATGATGAALKARDPAVHVTGLEIDPEMGETARKRLDSVIVGDVSEPALLNELGPEPYDCILCGDVLEHLRNPWRVLRELVQLTAHEAYVVVSLPNVAHLSTFAALLRGTWPYRPRGIHDRTHLRFFARRNVETLFAQAGLRILRLERNYRLIEHSHPANRFSRWVAAPGLRDLLTFQFLVLAQRGTGEQAEPRAWTMP